MAENRNRRNQEQQNRNPLAGLFSGMGGQGGGFGQFIAAILAIFTGGAGLGGLFSNLFNRDSDNESGGNAAPRRSILQRGRDAISSGIDSGRQLLGRGIDALKNLIGHHESGNDYNRVFGAGHKRMPLTDMTINQVLAWQRSYVNNGSASSAAGKYQIIQDTLRGLKSEMGLTGNEKFDAAMQDRMFQHLAQRRGLNDFLRGRISEDRFMRNLSQEWASLPKDNSGRSYYHGDGLNRAHATPASVRAALDTLQNDGVHYVATARTGQTLASTPRISSQLNRVSSGEDAPRTVSAAAPAPAPQRQVALMSPSPSLA